MPTSVPLVATGRALTSSSCDPLGDGVDRGVGRHARDALDHHVFTFMGELLFTSGPSGLSEEDGGPSRRPGASALILELRTAASKASRMAT